jgi:hypothetical protein
MTYLFVRMNRAGAHGLFRGRLGVVAAERIREQLFDKSGTRATGPRCLCVRTNFVESEKFLRSDCLDDVALADPVATADFDRIGEQGNRIGAAPARIAEMRLPEQQVFAHF